MFPSLAVKSLQELPEGVVIFPDVISNLKPLVRRKV
jgi:hypothetical protein